MTKSERGAIATVRLFNSSADSSKKNSGNTDTQKKNKTNLDLSKKKKDEVVVKVPSTKRTTPATLATGTNSTTATSTTTHTKRMASPTPTTSTTSTAHTNRVSKSTSTSTTTNKKVKVVKTKKVTTSAKETKNDTNKKEKNSRAVGQKAKRTKEPIKGNGGATPKKKTKKNAQGKGKEKESQEDNEDGELRIIDDIRNYLPPSEEEVEEYTVEAIVAHKVFKGKVIKYMVKWLGYDSKSNTEEMATLMHEDVPDMCKTYWSKFDLDQIPINAREDLKLNSNNNSSSNENKNKNENENENEKNKKKKEGNKDDFVGYKKNLYSDKHIPSHMAVAGYTFDAKWPTDETDWNEDIDRIVTVLPSVLDKNILFGYIKWVNGKTTAHIITEMHKHCPEKLALYYEERVQYIST